MTAKADEMRRRIKQRQQGFFQHFGPLPTPPRRSWWMRQPREGFTAVAVTEVRPDGVRVPFSDDPGRGR
jgi:hypothetical protein